ncbi:MAG TPA: phenylalanine 4-monooxygenase [Verrucomicrobiae bacterium]|nr:phenylalanine 4-monooxygenase [Verrucomicrobiae bacterium]
MYGANTTTELRGDYRHARPDFTIDQDVRAYSSVDQDMWVRLYRRQSALAQRYACGEFIEGLKLLDVASGVPDLNRVSDALEARTGWRLAAVPGFIPDAVFFGHLAKRRLPVTIWLRKPEEMDYLVEPDIFHDFFGHVPMLFNPVFADYVQIYGQRGLEAVGANALPLLARLYWYTVEFGLIETSDGLRTFGAGILSSAGETPFAIDSTEPHRVRFELERVMRTRYMIDQFQKTYFVVRSLDELHRAVAQDLRPAWQRLAPLPPLDPALTEPGDVLVQPSRRAAA